MLKIRGLCKTFSSSHKAKQPVEVLRSVDLEIHRGEFFSLLGPSGCGKTTLLRILAGLETPTSGSVEFEGQSLEAISAHRRPFHLVFQRYALFPHLTVWENVAFGPQVRRENRSDLSERVREALSLVKMEAFADRPVTTLSGGQQQRVALARALINRPQVLLLDEPFSALDLKLREQMRAEMLALQRRLKTTFILVTHDQEEALTLADRIAVMHQGRIEQVGTPHDIYEHPQTAFVAQFIGNVNVLEGSVRVSAPDAAVIDVLGLPRPVVVKRSRDDVRVPVAVTGARGRVLVRPEKLRLSPLLPGDLENAFEGTLKELFYSGAFTQFVVQGKEPLGITLTVLEPNTTVTARKPFSIGDRVYVAWHPEDCFLLV